MLLHRSTDLQFTATLHQEEVVQEAVHQDLSSFVVHQAVHQLVPGTSDQLLPRWFVGTR